jgi:integrase
MRSFAMHNVFTLFLRKYPNGQEVYFYYAYDKEGIRRGPWTTQNQNKVEARNYCLMLYKTGALLPDRKASMTFGEYAKGFWDRNSIYVTMQESRREISEDYLNNSRKYVANQLLPFFADTLLTKMNDKDINKWLLGFKKQTKLDKNGETVVKNYQNTYANTVFGTLNVMLEEAVRRDLLPSNPCDKVKRLKNDRRKMEILTEKEVHKLLPANYKTVWGSNFIAYTAIRLASLTGMRIGEILGLRGEFVFDKYIMVCGQFGEFGYKDHTKSRENRKLELIPGMISLLRKLTAKNGKGYVFSEDGGVNPVTNNVIRYAFENALEKIGISEEEIRKRRITLHSWRHFLNTDLLQKGLSITQVQGVTGHKSINMTNRYAHLDPNQIPEVMKAQQSIWGKRQAKNAKTVKKPAKSKEKAKTLKIVKKTDRKTA